MFISFERIVLKIKEIGMKLWILTKYNVIGPQKIQILILLDNTFKMRGHKRGFDRIQEFDPLTLIGDLDDVITGNGPWSEMSTQEKIDLHRLINKKQSSKSVRPLDSTGF